MDKYTTNNYAFDNHTLADAYEMDNSLNMRSREFICIVCPVGCPLTISGEGDDIRVTGHTCPRGEAYGKQEFLRPMRVVTSSVSVNEGDRPLVSVKTIKQIDKSRIPFALKEIQALRVNAPVSIGQVLIDDIAGTGVALVATTDIGIKHRM